MYSSRSPRRGATHSLQDDQAPALPPRYKVTYRYLTVPGAQRPAYTRSFWAACSRTPGRSKQDSSHQSTTGPARSAAPTTPGNAVRTKVPAGAPKNSNTATRSSRGSRPLSANRSRPSSASRQPEPEPEPELSSGEVALGVYPEIPKVGDPANLEAWGAAEEREFRRPIGHTEDYRSLQYPDLKYGEGETPAEDPRTVLSWKLLREGNEADVPPPPLIAREVVVRDAPRGVPCDTILETVSLDAGATYADLRTKLLGSAPEGTTLFCVDKGEQYVLPDLEPTKIVETEEVWLAREFWRTGDDYDNTRKYA